MTTPRSAVALLRSLDLMPDGPVAWDQPVRSRAPGVFLVEVPLRTDTAPLDVTAVRTWIERVPGLELHGERPTPTQLMARLASFWLPQQSVVYIGRTSKSLGARVASMSHTLLGDRKPHPGGHWLWTLQDPSRLRIWWAETDAPEEYEDGLAAAIAADLDPVAAATLGALGPILPWANLTSATGEAKHTGITGAQLREGEAPGVPSRPSAATPATRKAAPTRSAPTRRAGTTRTARTSAPTKVTTTMVTASGLAALQAEHEALTSVQRPEVILRVKAARELGDLRENADYEAARREQSFLEGRIRELEAMIKTAVVIQVDDPGVIGLGSHVTVDVEGVPATLRIVGSSEADAASGRISDVSPVGRALLGHRAGDEVTIQTPGRPVHYRIVGVTAG